MQFVPLLTQFLLKVWQLAELGDVNCSQLAYLTQFELSVIHPQVPSVPIKQLVAVV
jgi:hypothetical protein